MKFLIYIVGLRRNSGQKAGEFFYNEKHDKFIYQNRELDADEFNTLMAQRWPLQNMANQQVSGFAITAVEEVAQEPTKPTKGESLETPKPPTKKAKEQ